MATDAQKMRTVTAKEVIENQLAIEKESKREVTDRVQKKAGYIGEKTIAIAKKKVHEPNITKEIGNFEEKGNGKFNGSDFCVGIG